MDTNKLLRRYKRMAAEHEPFVEERAILNDKHRSHVEVGYDVSTLSMDNERVMLEKWLGELVEEEEKSLKAIAFARRKARSSEHLWELKCEISSLERTQAQIKEVAQRLNDINKSLNERLGDFSPEQGTEESTRYECRKLHYQISHDMNIRRERKLRWMFWGSRFECNEARAKNALKRIETLHKREAMTIQWYWTLAMLVIKYAIQKNFVTAEDIAAFSRLDKEGKRRARRDKRNFWVAAADRLMNLRKAIKDFKHPTNNYTLEVLETSYNESKGEDEDENGIHVYTQGNPYSLTEDVLIKVIDYVHHNGHKE